MFTESSLAFLSHDGVSTIKGSMWLPTEQVKGIIQIVHGMEEHIGRYTNFVQFLVQAGFAVCAADMLGHGQSVTSPKKLSCIPAKNGARILVEDVHTLRNIAASFVPEAPFFLFGHSMGSFIVRDYLTQYGDGLVGAVLCGSGQQPLGLSRAGNVLARFLAVLRGEDHKSPLLENMGAGAYAKKIDNPRTQFDWLSVDEAVVDAYSADPLCGVPFSAGGYAALTELTGKVATAQNALLVPKGLPVLFIAGALDPVGENGKGVCKAAKLLQDAGVTQVDVILYEGMRHEVLNEPEKQKVYDDVLQWAVQIVQGKDSGFPLNRMSSNEEAVASTK